MNGLKRNTAKLFQDKGKLFVLAMDHAQGGIMNGLEKPDLLLNSLADSKVDGFILNVGMADRMVSPTLINKKLILRTSFGGSSISTEYTNVHKNYVSPETALSLGADAVLMMFVMGGADFKSIQDAASSIDGYHKLGIPVIVEILSSDYSKTTTYEIQSNGARVAAELGADVVKAFYTENFDKVIETCPCPLILAGGPKGTNIIEIARDAIKSGARGLAFGRNIFQSPEPERIINELYELF